MRGHVLYDDMSYERTFLSGGHVSGHVSLVDMSF